MQKLKSAGAAESFGVVFLPSKMIKEIITSALLSDEIQNLLYKSEKIKKTVSRRRRTVAASELKLTAFRAQSLSLARFGKIRFTHTHTSTYSPTLSL